MTPTRRHLDPTPGPWIVYVEGFEPEQHRSRVAAEIAKWRLLILKKLVT